MKKTEPQKTGNGQNSYGKLIYEWYSFERINESALVIAMGRCGPDAVKRLSLDNRGYNRFEKNLDGRSDILEGPRCIGKLGLLVIGDWGRVLIYWLS